MENILVFLENKKVEKVIPMLKKWKYNCTLLEKLSQVLE